MVAHVGEPGGRAVAGEALLLAQPRLALARSARAASRQAAAPAGSAASMSVRMKSLLMSATSPPSALTTPGRARHQHAPHAELARQEAAEHRAGAAEGHAA